MVYVRLVIKNLKKNKIIKKTLALFNYTMYNINVLIKKVEYKALKY